MRPYKIINENDLYNQLLKFKCSLEPINSVIFVSVRKYPDGKDVIARIYKVNTNPQDPKNGQEVKYLDFFLQSELHLDVKKEIENYLKNQPNI